MNYKDLFERYKKGLLNEEEKQLVEKELERHEAVEDYLSEELDEEFIHIKETPSLDEQEEETIKIKKHINKWAKKIILTSVLIVVVLYIGIFHIASGIIDRIYYDPTAVTLSAGEEYPTLDIDYDMQTYVDLNMPGYTSSSFMSIESKGFGKYGVSYPLKNHFNQNEQRNSVSISRGGLTYAMDGVFGRESRFGIWEGFEKIKYHPEEKDEDIIESRNERIISRNEETIDYLNKLNPLSYISMNILFQRDLTMEEIYYLSNEDTSLDFRWVGIRTVEHDTLWDESQPMHLIGFNIKLTDGRFSENVPDREKYPMFYLLDVYENNYLDDGKLTYPEKMASAYETHFRSRLDYFRQREDFINIFDYNSFKKDFYDKSLEYIDENGVKSYGVLVYGTAEGFLENIDKIPYETIYINEVLPIKPNVYY